MDEKELKLLIEKKKLAQQVALNVNNWLLTHYELYSKWVVTTDKKYFFILVHPTVKGFAIHRWGFSRKPFYFSTEISIRVHCPDYMTTIKNVYEVVDKIVDTFGDAHFCDKDSDLPPSKPPKLSKLSSSKTEVHKLGDYMLKEMGGVDMTKVQFMR